MVDLLPAFPVVPAKAGIHSELAQSYGLWIPAFAGMTRERHDPINCCRPPSHNPIYCKAMPIE
jgi:hypothetical protein